ncbi:DUF1080 domain-containing protein [bacterium]|nr:DUF1080 domain-containing protein [bacterium]
MMSRLLFLSWMVFSPMGGNAESIPKEMLGDWSLNLKSGEAGWLSVSEKDGLPSVAMAVDVGSIKPLSNVTVKEEKIYIPIKKFRKGGKNGKLVRTTRAVVWSENGKLVGEVISLFPDGREEKDPFTGKFVPPMPPKPDLAKVKFGKPVTLFNGKDLTGWKLRRPEKLNGWSVKDGLLVNETPKTDFSATGAYGNLRTEAVFGDFKLHIEFLVERDRNSGVYLRGMYEAQVVDRDSRMQGLQGVGAIFGRVAPSKNAGYEGGKWQTYDLTLVGRHITVILNGEKVVDNQPVPGPTGGAMHTDAMAPGPIYLQGDHTSVKYRNIVLRPAE